jgi:1-deoxy-D-xylulose-5-phosphate synthase
MLRLALEAKGPTAIRYPRTAADPPLRPAGPLTFGIGQAEVLRRGPDGAFIAYGSMASSALAAAERLAMRDIFVTVVNARFAKPLDRSLLARVIRQVPLTLTVEEHVASGGFGSAVLEMVSAEGIEAPRVERLAIPDRFVEHASRSQLLKGLGLNADGIEARFIALREGLARPDASAAPRQDVLSSDSKNRRPSP